MSGGIAYVYDVDGNFKNRCNTEMVDLSTLSEDEDIQVVKQMIEKHVEYTGSSYAENILENFDPNKFVKVLPTDYMKIMQSIKKYKEQGLSEDEVLLAAFEENR